MDRGAASALLSEALKALGRMIGGQSTTDRCLSTIRENRLQQINDYMDMHLSDPQLSLETVAKECGISLRYLCHLFQASGTTFSTVLRRKRQEKAREWLSASHMYRKTITEIAELAGYRSVASFSRTFRSEHGCTPRDYRKRLMT